MWRRRLQLVSLIRLATFRSAGETLFRFQIDFDVFVLVYKVNVVLQKRQALLGRGLAPSRDIARMRMVGGAHEALVIEQVARKLPA